MSLYKRPDSGGAYWYDFLFGGRRYRGSTKHTNLRAAERVENTLKIRLANSRFGIEELKLAPLFRDFAPRFLEMVRPELRPNGYRIYAVCVRNLLPVFGLKSLDEIAPAMIQEFKEARLQAGRAGATVNRDLATLRRIFSIALKLDVVRGTPFAARRVEFCKESARERVLTFTEELNYLSKATQPLRDVATLIVETGLRHGEACSARCEDVHLFTATPFLHVLEGKTVNAVRDVPLTAKAVEVLKRRLAEARRVEREKKIEAHFLFPARVGTGHDWQRPMNELEPAHQKSLKLSAVKPFRLYDLRHTFASRAVEAGMDALTLKAVMGHADLKTTSRYVHPTFRHLAEAQAKVEQFRAVREIAEADAAKGASVMLQ
jgi:integrase